MRFAISLMSLALLAPTILACKCIGGTNPDATRLCCGAFEGNFQVDDCAADSLHAGLAPFGNCCRKIFDAGTDC